MKILFTFSGMPHYLTNLLDNLHTRKDFVISVILPKSKSANIGKGVKLVNKELDFEVRHLDEYMHYSQKPYFKNFRDEIKKINPDIIVIGWPYILPLSLDFKTLKFIRKNKIGLIYREIPFMVAPLDKAFSYYKENPIFNEDLKTTMPQGFSFYVWAFVLRFLRKRYYRLINATLAYSDIAYEVHESYGLKREQIFVSYNSPDTDKLLSTKNKLINEGVTKKPFQLLHVGRLVKWKQVDVLISSVAELLKKYPKAVLNIVGNGPEEENLRNQAKLLKIESSINFIGSVYDPIELGRIFLESDIYILAGMGGLSINEAMAFGKPVICSVCDGTEKKLVRENYNGAYFENGNINSLTHAIDRLFSDPSLIEKMGDRSSKIIETEVNIHTVTEKFIEAFNFVQKNRK